MLKYLQYFLKDDNNIFFINLEQIIVYSFTLHYFIYLLHYVYLIFIFSFLNNTYKKFRTIFKIGKNI